MKKLTFFTLALLMSVSLVFGGWSCKKDPNVIRVNEVTHSIFYAPMYIAINKGYFRDEGLTIELTNGGGADKSMAALLSNGADIALMGPEQAIYAEANGAPDVPKIFGQLTKRDGSFLIGRTNQPNFMWSDLAGSEIIAGRRGGVPAMTLEYALNQNGLYDGDNITLNYDIAFNNMGPAFIGGIGDYVTMFDPAATELITAGSGYMLASVGQEAGEVPFTAFMAKSSYITKNKEIIKSFLRAIIRGYNYLTAANVDEVVSALKPSFNTTSDASLRASVINYRNIDAWSSTPIMSESAYNRLITIMTNAGELSTSVAYSSVVDNRYATQVMLEFA